MVSVGMWAFGTLIFGVGPPDSTASIQLCTQEEIWSTRVKTAGLAGLQEPSPRLVTPTSTGVPSVRMAIAGPPESPWQVVMWKCGASSAQTWRSGSKKG